MTKKEKFIYLAKLILELAIFILLILTIIYLVKSENGIISSIKSGTAREKVDEAIGIYVSSTDTEKNFEQTLRKIEGLEDIQIDEEMGIYELTIDGEKIMVTKRNKSEQTEETKEYENNEQILEQNEK